MERQTLLKKLKSLRTRIEDWCNLYGYDKMGNVVERKNRKGEVVWHRTDWEHVDSMHNLIYNDEEYYLLKIHS